MSTLLSIDRVQYLIKDNKDTLPLARLYFCIYCKSLKTPDSLQFEIDCHFCPQTLDGLPPGEAASKKNKSSNSWQCPFCFHNLSTRATNTTIQSPDDPSKTVQKKSYYQACNFCRWTSRCVGILDKEIVSGGWSEAENPNQPRIQNLMEYYKSLSSKEIAELDQKKSSKKKGYFSLAMQLQQKYGPSSTALGRKQTAALSSTLSALRVKESIKEVNISPSETVGLQQVERLPDDIYTRPMDFMQATNIEQRLDQPFLPTHNASELKPRKSQMLIKRSLRCKTCDHNIIKPEYNASSIKFKINLSAIQHVPEVRINHLPDLEPGKRSKVTLSIINPTENVMHVTLGPAKDEQQRSNAQIEFPTSSLILSKYDETAEYSALQGDDEDVVHDDPDVVAFRSANKLGFYVYVTPDVSLSGESEVWISFTFAYEHHGTVPVAQMLKSAEGERKPEVVSLDQTVSINLGKMKVQTN